METSDDIVEVKRYSVAMYAKRHMNLSAFLMLVRAHIPEECMKNGGQCKIALCRTSKTPCNMRWSRTRRRGPTAARHSSSRSSPNPCRGSWCTPNGPLCMAKKFLELWHEAIIWLMPTGTVLGELILYRPMALGQQDMRFLMTHLMRRFMALLARKGMATDWQIGSLLGSKAAVSAVRRKTASQPFTCPRP